jgi:hypothetical protein
VSVLFVDGAGAGTASQLSGYWQHEFRRNGRTDFDAATLECYLGIVAFASLVFSEERSVATIGDAFDVLFLAGNEGSRREQLDRELLVAWLNFANGAFTYDGLVDANGDGVDETPYAEVMAQIEAVRRDAAATAEALEAVTTLLHSINVSRVGSGE